jgi:predicted amidohydrolase
VAAAQAASVGGDVDANVATAVDLVTECAASGARLVVLPELFLTGYDPDGWSDAWCLGEPAEDPRLRPLREAALSRHVVVVAGAALSGPGQPATGEPVTGQPATGEPRRTVSLLVFDDRGEVHRGYDKQHLFDAERKFFTAGDHGASIVVDGWELGLGICYDGCFPEHAMAAAADGAAAYLCPSAYYAGAEHRRDVYYAARALDNGIYVVFAGLAGRCGGYEFSGGSAVYDPEGRPVDRVGGEVPAVAYADLDPAEVARVREMNPIGRDRRASLGTRHRRVLGD